MRTMKTLLFLTNTLFVLTGLLHSQETDVNTANWKPMVNIYGWSIKYPPDWDAHGKGHFTPETTNGPIITGPIGGYKKGIRVGTIQIAVLPITPNQSSKISNLSLIQYVEKYCVNVDTADKKILSGPKKIQVGGLTCYEIVYRRNKEYGGHKTSKVIYFKFKGKIGYIDYWEDFHDQKIIKSINDWELTSTFEKIISTIKFRE